MQRGARLLFRSSAPMQRGARFPIRTSVPMQRGVDFGTETGAKKSRNVMYASILEQKGQKRAETLCTEAFRSETEPKRCVQKHFAKQKSEMLVPQGFEISLGLD